MQSGRTTRLPALRRGFSRAFVADSDGFAAAPAPFNSGVMLFKRPTRWRSRSGMGDWLHGMMPEIIILGLAGGVLAVLMSRLARRARDRRRATNEAEGRRRVEEQFREAERRLDELLSKGEPAITARGVAVADWSARAYHYKNETLSWSYQFETRRTRGSEIEKVTVTLTLREDDTTALRVQRCAEIFQIGRPSRWISTDEELLPLEDVARRGLSAVVLEAINEGEAAAAAAA